MHCLNSSASAAVKVSATQNAENVAQKVVKMFTTSAKKTALLKSCMKEDISSQEETKRYLVGLCETWLVKCHVSIPVKHSKLGAKFFNKVCPKTVQNALKWPLQCVNFQKFSGAACPQTRAVDLGGPSFNGGRPKFEIKHKSRCLQKRKVVIWGGQACRLGRPGPPWRRPCPRPSGVFFLFLNWLQINSAGKNYV